MMVGEKHALKGLSLGKCQISQMHIVSKACNSLCVGWEGCVNGGANKVFRDLRLCDYWVTVNPLHLSTHLFERPNQLPSMSHGFRQ
jgi:hypothetical protein